MNRESPFLSREIEGGPPAGQWRTSVERLLRESPYANLEFAAGEDDRATEALDDEAEARAQPLEPQPFEVASPEGESELSAERRDWVHALDRSALELLTDETSRRRYLEEIDWRTIEFPDALYGASPSDVIRSHWKLSKELFSAMTTVVPERRVPIILKYRGEPQVAPVPGQGDHQLYPEAADAFVRLQAAAAADRVTLHINSSFRSEARQAAIRRNNKNPSAVAQKTSAHTYGLAVDLRMSVTGLSVLEAGASSVKNREKMGNVVRMYRSPVYKWLALRAREFGWYPFRNEPWHWEYNPPGFADRYAQGRSVRADARVEVPIVAPSSPGPTSTELVRFAQRVLNAVQGERLSDDGKLGPMTRAALARFRTNNALGAGATLDGATELALAQRALEEIGQASMFAQVGARDAKTSQAIASFKSARGLGIDSTLDARTRLALTDALAKRVAALGREYEADFGYDHNESVDDHEGMCSDEVDPAEWRGEEVEAEDAQDEGEALELEDAPATADREFLGGKLTTFTAQTLGLRTAVFCPKSALGQQNVDVLFFAHGLLGGCPRPKQLPSGFIADAPFRLGKIVHDSGRPVILVLPLLDWSNPGGAAAFGKSHPRWHALAKPETFNAFLGEALAEVGRAQGAAAPAIDELIVAGHSRAYDFLEPLAAARAEPAMQQGALARLRQVWALDTTYGGQLQRWTDWLGLDPSLRVAFFYRPHTQTAAIGDTFYAKRSARLAVKKVPESHCSVPGKRLPALLAVPPASAHESGDYEDEREACGCAKESEQEQELGSDLSERFTLDAFEPDAGT